MIRDRLKKELTGIVFDGTTLLDSLITLRSNHSNEMTNDTVNVVIRKSSSGFHTNPNKSFEQ